MHFLRLNERNNLMSKLFGFAEFFKFESLPHPVSVGIVMHDANGRNVIK